MYRSVTALPPPRIPLVHSPAPTLFPEPPPPGSASRCAPPPAPAQCRARQQPGRAERGQRKRACPPLARLQGRTAGKRRRPLASGSAPSPGTGSARPRFASRAPPPAKWGGGRRAAGSAGPGPAREKKRSGARGGGRRRARTPQPCSRGARNAPGCSGDEAAPPPPKRPGTSTAGTGPGACRCAADCEAGRGRVQEEPRASLGQGAASALPPITLQQMRGGRGRDCLRQRPGLHGLQGRRHRGCAVPNLGSSPSQGPPPHRRKPFIQWQSTQQTDALCPPLLSSHHTFLRQGSSCHRVPKNGWPRTKGGKPVQCPPPVTEALAKCSLCPTEALSRQLQPQALGDLGGPPRAP